MLINHRNMGFSFKFFLSSSNGRIFILSVVFSILILFIDTIVVRGKNIVNFVDFISNLYDLNNLLYALFLLLIVFTYVIFLCGFIYFSFTSKQLLKIPLIIIFIIAIVMEYECGEVLYRFSKKTDFQAAAITPWDQRLDFFISHFNWLSIIPIGLFFYFNKIISKIERTSSIYSSIIFIVFSTIFFFSLSVFKHQIFPRLFFYPVNSVANFVKSNTDFLVAYIIHSQYSRSALPSNSATDNTLDNNIVFIVDESLRSDHMSIYGYQRATTPFLDTLYEQGEVVKFPSCTSGSTNSDASSKLLLTGLPIHDLPDVFSKIYTLPTLFQYAKAMGYKTHFYDGQTNRHWLGGRKDYEYVDNWKNYNFFIDRAAGKVHNIDIELAKEISYTINNSSGNFIWVWKRGVHFPYYNNFIIENPTYIPIATRGRKIKDRQKLINTYDNGIIHNVDHFFRVLYQHMNKNDLPIIVYTSDHGQSLLDDDFTTLHAGINKEQANVPLLLLGDLKDNIDTKARVSHENIFPTLLDIMDVPISLRQYDYASSLLDSLGTFPLYRYYWSPDIARGEPILFDD